MPFATRWPLASLRTAQAQARSTTANDIVRLKDLLDPPVSAMFEAAI